MNTKIEIIDAIEGQYKGDLPPPVLFTQTGTLGQMQHCGASWPDAHRDKEKMIKLALQPSEMFGFATARIPYDVSTEAEAIGCYVSTGTEINQPTVTGSPWRDSMTFPSLDELPSVDEFLSHDRIRTVIESAEAISSNREDLFVTSMCLTSAGIASHIMGMENMIMFTITDPDSSIKLVDDIIPFSTAYARELSDVSDNVMIIASVLTGIMTPEFNRLTAKRDAKVVSAIRNSYSMVHNCGNTFDNIEDLIAMSPDIMSLETSSRPHDFLRIVGKRCKMLGCISPVHVLLPGTPESVKAEALRSAELGFDLVGPECGVPPMTPNENLKALADYRN